MLMNTEARRLRKRIWWALIGAVTLVIGAAYAMAQQSTRLAADDAPLATAQVSRQLLESGTKPGNAVPATTTNFRLDNSVFVIVADKSRNILASSGVLDNGTPLPPPGTFDYAQAHGSDHFTWEPESGVRLATQVLPYKDGYVIAGQSLKQAESRIGFYGTLALAAWLTAVAWVTLVLLLPRNPFKGHGR